MEVLKMTSRPLGLFNAQRRIRKKKQEQLLWLPRTPVASAHFRSQRIIHERHDKIHCRFTIQLTERKLKRNKKPPSAKHSDTSHNRILFSFKQTRQNKHYKTATQNNSSLPEKKFQSFPTTAKRLLIITIYFLTKKTTTKKRNGDCKQPLAYLKQ